MKKLFLLIVLALMVGTVYPVYAQDNKQKTEVSLKNDTKTTMVYKARDGKEYPVYVSKNGKCFCVRVSQKTGKEYKYYLPKYTEQLNKERK